jgi:dTDP-4-dehydrorhamnose reductase
MNFLKPCHSDEFPGKVTRPNYSVLDKTKIKKALDIEIPYWRVSMLDCIITLD